MSDYVPNELWIDIFTRLPVKTLLQIRCVSKSWCSVISSPSFIKDYLDQSIVACNTNNNHLLLIRHYSGRPHKKEHYSLHCDNHNLKVDHVDLECPFQTLNRKLNTVFRVVDSCNGVICLSDDFSTFTNTVILWNPTIRKWVALPEPHFTFKTHGRYYHVIGFGYDSRSDDYKVVRLTYLEEEPDFVLYRSPAKVELYSLRIGAWRCIGNIAPLYYIRYDSSQAFVNCAVHWLGFDQANSRRLIYLFNMADEVFSEMSLPESVLENSVLNMSIDVFDGSLAVFNYDVHMLNKSCSIWVMKEYGAVESWTKIFTIGSSGMLGRMLGFRRNGEVLLVTRGEGLMTSYDPKSQRFKDLVLRGGSGSEDSFCVRSYVPSLVLLEHKKGAVKGRQQFLSRRRVKKRAKNNRVTQILMGE